MNIRFVIKGILLSFLVFTAHPIFANHQHELSEQILPVNREKKSKGKRSYKIWTSEDVFAILIIAGLPALLLSGAFIVGAIIPILWLWILTLSVFGFGMFFSLFHFLLSDQDSLDAIILLLPLVGGLFFGLAALIAGLVSLLSVLWITGVASLLFCLLMIPLINNA